MPTPTVQDTLKARLIARAGISAQELVNNSLAGFLDESVAEHSSLYAPAGIANYALIPVPQYELVIILAWIRVCEFRASNAAPQASIHGVGGNFSGGFGSDRDTPFKKNMEMIKYLRALYLNRKTEIETEQSETGTGDITVGELYRNDELIDAAVPLHVAPPLRAPSLTVGAIVDVAGGGALAGSVVLSWPAIYSEFFAEILVFRGTASGLYENWNVDGIKGVAPFINSNATLVYRTTDNIAKGLKNTGLAAGTYYYVLVLRDSSGRFSYSNEVSVAIPATTA